MTIDSLRDARVLVTGGKGFLGQHICRALSDHGISYRAIGNYQGLWTKDGYNQYGADLTNPFALPAFMDCFGPFDVVFHLAGYNGGISFNKTFPADIFYRNTLMGLNVLEACKQARVKKVVSVVASCGYPDWNAFDPMREYGILYEDEFLKGEPHETVACHGYAKRNLQLASSFYRQQYDLMAVCACPTTLYGPGDSFDPARTKVMGAMVKRFVDAVDEGQEEVICWGSGEARREFLYVEDAARLLVQTMLHYDDSDLPLNLGTGQELSVRELAETVARCVKFDGKITWDTTKPDGQLRKRLDLTRMRQVIPSYDITGLEDGIRKTAEYYRTLRRQERAA